MVAALFFYLFSALRVASAVMVISSRNPVHSVLFLILCFFNAAGLFILLGAEFLAMILVVVYVGAVAVLFLFVVMMLDVDFVELRQGMLNYLPVGGTIGLIVLVELALVVGSLVDRSGLHQDHCRPHPRRHHQHRGAGPDSLHAIHLLLPGGRTHPAGRHDRRHRADTAPQAGRQAPEHRRSGGAHPATAIEIGKVKPGQGI